VRWLRTDISKLKHSLDSYWDTDHLLTSDWHSG